jgi:hypothetical protein
MSTGNNGLMLDGLNGLFQPWINAGVGGPSPYGGTITGKKIIGLDPAQSADGSIHPNMVIPRLEVTTSHVGPDGNNLYYHAPMTQGRSIDPVNDNQVAALDVQDSSDKIGQMGTMLTALDHPDAQAKMQRGASDPRVQQYLDALTTAYQPANPVAAKEQVINRYMHDHNVDENTAIARLQQLGFLPMPARVGGAYNDMLAAEDMVQRGLAPDFNSAMNIIQRTTHALPKVGGTSSAGGGSGLGTGGLPGTTDTTGTMLTGEDFLKKLSPADRESVLDVAHDPSLLQGVSIAKGRREHIQQLVSQYQRVMEASGAPGAANLQIGKGLPGMDVNGKPVGGDNPANIRFYALATIGGNTSWQQGLSRGQDGVRFIKEVKNAIPGIMVNELGMQPGDLGSNAAMNKALQVTLQDRTKYSAAVEQLSGTLDKQATLVESLLDKAGATGVGPLVNKPYNYLREKLGSDDFNTLQAALIGLGREHQRVLVSPLSNAQLAVQAQATGDKIANPDMTPSSIRAVIGVMRKEVANARAQAADTISAQQQRLRDMTPTMQGTTPQGGPAMGGAPAPTAPAAGTQPAAPTLTYDPVTKSFH